MPRFRIGALALFLSATPSASGQDKKTPPAGPPRFETAHFAIFSSAGAVPAKDFDAMIEGLYALWRKRLGGPSEETRKLKLALYFDRAEYAREGGRDASFFLKGDSLHVLCDPLYFQSIAAGGTRLYLAAAYPRMSGRKDLPPWIAEGLSDYFAPAVWKEDKVQIDSAKAPETTKNVASFQLLAKSPDWSPFEKSFRAEGRDYENRRRQIALQAWALFYYLSNAPGEDGGQGKNGQAASDLLAALEGGKGVTEALGAMSKKTVGGAIPALESVVKDYFLKFKVELPGRDDADWVSGETAHYLIQVQKGTMNAKTKAAERQILADLKGKMELLYQKYSLAFRFQGALPQKAAVKVYKTEAAYAAGRGPKGSAAYYDPNTKELVGYEGGEEVGDLFQNFCHEGCHQFFDLAFPGFYASDNIPEWFSEGLAECFAASEIRGKDLYVFTLGGVAENRLYWMKEGLKQEKYTPLKSLLQLNHQSFLADANLHYCESWSFVHFLWNAPSADQGKGTYHEVVVRLIDGFKQGKSRDEVYKTAFQRGGRAINLDELEKEWKGYVSTLKLKK